MSIFWALYLNTVILVIGSSTFSFSSVLTVNTHEDQIRRLHAEIFSKIVFIPHAPGSGICSCLSLSPSTYALLPALASRFLVASAASLAARTASVKFFPSLEEMALMKAARGSTRVREGGRARV